MSSSIAQKVDTQARVIRSLNLIHCADTRHMVGAVELERLLNLEVENLELKRRIQRLENAGDGLSMWVCPEYKSDPANLALIEWRKAKEATP